MEIEKIKIDLPDHLTDKQKAAIEAKLAIYNAALAGDVNAQIEYLHNAGWKD